jgi:hypothetical protein
MIRNAWTFIVISLLCLVFFVCMATCTSCSILHKVKSKKIEHFDSSVNASKETASQKKVDAGATKTTENDYNKITVELPEGGIVSLPGDKDAYNFPAKSKITFEKGTTKETSSSNKKTVESNSSSSNKSTNVKKDREEKNATVARNKFLPGIGYIIAIIVLMALTTFFIRKYWNKIKILKLFGINKLFRE